MAVFMIPNNKYLNTFKRYDPSVESNRERILMWKSGVKIFKDYPMGVGIHNLSKVYPKYKYPEAYMENQGHLHNNIMQFAVERGILGVLAYIFLVYAFYLTALKRLNFTGRNADRIVLFGAIGGMTGFVFSGFFEYDFGASFLVLNFWFFIGLAFSVMKRVNKEKRAAVFLDRDGTINIDYGYISDKNKVTLYKGASKGIRKINDADVPVIVVTNQSGIGRGYFTARKLKRVHKRLQKMLYKENKAIIDDIYYCPHEPKVKCNCRKPKTTLLKQAAKKFNIDLKKSFIAGDKKSDILLGKNAGMKTILVMTGDKKEIADIKKIKPDYLAKDLNIAAEYIISDMRK
jgi:D,D-heptose 1,7-bisphosphate phosphatase